MCFLPRRRECVPFCLEGVNPKRPKVESIHNPTLFPMANLEEAAELAGELKIERPHSLPGILLGTSAFTAAGSTTLGPAMLAPFNRAVWEFYAHRKAVRCSLQTVNHSSDLRKFPR